MTHLERGAPAIAPQHYARTMSDSELAISPEAIGEVLHQAREAHAAAQQALRRAEGLAASAGLASEATGSITAQRINIVEPDGTLRLVITNAAQLPGAILHGQEYDHPNRPPAAGFLMFNDEATEMGGFLWAGSRTEAGHQNVTHMSYDNFEQDQVIVLSSYDDGPDEQVAMLEFTDRPGWSLADAFQAAEGSPADEQQSAMADFLSSHDTSVPRVRLAREANTSVGLTLRDREGRPRIVLQVDSDGTPAIELLDAQGKVVSRLPPTSAKT